MPDQPMLLPPSEAEIAMRRAVHHARRVAKRGCEQMRAIGVCAAGGGVRCFACPRRVEPIVKAAVEITARERGRRR